jgi:DNA replication protein DnaD
MGPDGWVKLYRKTQKSDMYKNLNSVQRDVMINCLMLANHKENKWEWNGEIFEAEPGQFITSLSSLKEVCAKDVSIQNIRTALKKLERWDFLTNKSTKTGRLITIVNWGKYQGLDCEVNKDNNKEVTKNQQSTNKELTTNKNDKNVKNEKKKGQDSSSPDIYDPKYDSDSRPFKAACYLRDRILENNPRQPVPEKEPEDMESWATEMDRLNRLGPVGAKDKGYTWKEIGKLIDWCQDHHFWKSNILSAGKFREKIVKLENQMKSESPKKNKQAQKDDLLRKIYAEAEG